MSIEKMNPNNTNSSPGVESEKEKKHIRKNRKKSTGCLFLIGCFSIVILIVICIIAGIVFSDSFKSFFSLKGLDGKNSVSVTIKPSDQKQITYSESNQKAQDSQIVDIVKNANTASVSIALASNQPLGRFGGNVKDTQVIGSGFVVDKQNGYVVTNQHVACVGTSQTFKVITSDNKVFNVKNIYQDPNDDVAVFQLDTSKDQLPSQLTLSSADVSVGQTVIAIGNPSGLTGSVSTGVLSGINRNIQSSGTCQNGQVNNKDYYQVYQTDAAINPGNSGGPLLDLNGNVVGVNSATGVSVQNISFSVPISRVIRKLQELKQYGNFKNPYLGVSYEMIDNVNAQVYKLQQGAYVDTVAPGSPAEKAGVQQADIISEISGKKINFSLTGVISQFNVGDSVQLKISRSDASGNNTKEITLTAILSEKSNLNQ